MALGRTGKRLLLDPAGQVHVIDVPVPDVGPNDVLVRTTLSQVSAGTEMNDVRKRRAAGADPAEFADMGLGYTTVGIVERVGQNVRDFKPGDRVLGQGNHGSFWVVPWNQADVDAGLVNSPYLEHVPDMLEDVEIAFASLGDVALHAVRHGKIQLGESAAVYGLGQIGLMALQLCRLNGAYPVLGLDPAPERRALAEQLGAAWTFDPTADGVVGAKTLASSRITVATKVLFGDPGEQIEAEAGSGRYGLVVVGSPPLRSDPAESIGGVVGRLLASPAAPSVLIVRSTP